MLLFRLLEAMVERLAHLAHDVFEAPYLDASMRCREMRQVGFDCSVLLIRSTYVEDEPRDDDHWRAVGRF